jgi:hypothetical protein
MENGFFKHMPLPVFLSKIDNKTVFLLTGGFTRYEAALRARERGSEIQKLPVVPHPAGTNYSDMQLRMYLDNTGAPLKPWERGVVIKRLINNRWSEDEIAKKMVISKTYVSDLLYLHSLPQELQNLVVNEQVSGGQAVKMARELGHETALQEINEVIATTGPPEALAEQPSRPRVRPSQTRAKGQPRKEILGAIDYAIALESLEFISNWLISQHKPWRFRPPS